MARSSAKSKGERLCYLESKKTDIPAYTSWMAEVLIRLKYFSDAQGKMNLSQQDIQGEILIVYNLLLCQLQ